MNRFFQIPRRARSAAFAFVLFASSGFAQTSDLDFDKSGTFGITGEDNSIRPFHVKVPESALVDLRQRLASARLPDPETDPSQGVRLATMKELVRYWQIDYDWRKAEARLNALPQFVTMIDGEEIYFIHVRSKLPNATTRGASAIALAMTHGRRVHHHSALPGSSRRPMPPAR